MTAYYNEIDPYCAGWLRNLIAKGLIAHGHVDTRSIADVVPNDLAGFAQCHFFAGAGGWSGALRLAAWPDHRPVWTGSCPCQPFSVAGRQGGFADERHLWPFFRYLIAQRRPATVLGEQVASAAQWLGLVRGDLEALDYAVGAIPVEAASAGADHLRDRFWFVGHREGIGGGTGLCEGDKIEYGNGFARASSDDVGLADRQGWLQGQQAAPAARHGGATVAAGGADLADADDTGSQGRRILPERGGQRVVGPDGVADADRDAIRNKSGWRGGTNGSGKGQHLDDRSGGISNAASEQARSAGQSWERERLDWVIGADGKARRVKSLVCCLVNGIWCGLAGVRAGLAFQAAKEVIRHVQKSARSPGEILSLVQNVYAQEALQRATGMRVEFPEKEVLFAFLFDIAPACDGTADGRRFAQAHGFNAEGALRSLRIEDIDLGPSCQRRADGQFAEQFTDSLLSLSWVLAWHAETDRRITEQAHANTIPLLAKGEINRVAKLRALGNAIDLRPAAEFIKAVM